MKNLINKRAVFQHLVRRYLSTSCNAKNSQHVIESRLPTLNIPQEPVSKFIWDQNVQKHGDKTALVDGITKKSYTYQESSDLSQKFGSALLKKGFVCGDVIGILMPNCVEYVLAFTGAAGVGMTTTTFNPAYTPAEVSRQIITSKAKVMLTNSAFAKTVLDAIKLSGCKVDLILSDQDPQVHGQEAWSMADLLQDDGSAYTDVYPNFDFNNDVVLLPYSSGTTGLPKGVMLTHANLVGNTLQCVYPKELECIRPATETYQASTLGILPMFHIFGIGVVTMHTLAVGGKMTTLPGFDPQTFLATLEITKPDVLHLVPPLVQFCAYNPVVKPHHLESLEFVFIGAAPVGEVLASKFKEKAPNCQFREGWGMTELSPVGTMTAANDEVLGSCGILLPNSQGKVVDLVTGEALPAGERGELCIKGPQVMKGYFDNESATLATQKDGWLYSGDIGYYDDKGRFYIVDRLKELIKVKGFQVAPAELEDLLRLHDGIADVAVIGVPDARHGELPRAYIVKANPDLDEDTVHKFIEAEVADYKQLRGGIEFIEAIPKSAAGKILRRQLRDLWAAKEETVSSA